MPSMSGQMWETWHASLQGLPVSPLALSIAGALFLVSLSVLVYKRYGGQSASRKSISEQQAPVKGALSTRAAIESNGEGQAAEAVEEDSSWLQQEYDAIVVGAGVAGSALAFALGKEGRKVLVLERDLSEPDRIVGELLQPGGYLKLVELGLADAVDGIDAQLVHGYALMMNGKQARVAYPKRHVTGTTELVAGRSFHHGRFIMKLRGKLAEVPSVTVRQATVLSLIEDEPSEGAAVHGVTCRVGPGREAEVRAAMTFVCDGCFSRLRRSLSVPKVENPSNFVGLILDNCPLPVPNHGHVVLADPSPILLYPISSTEVRCLVDVPGEKVPSISSGDMQRYLSEKVAPQMPLKVQKAFLAAVAKGDIRVHPNRIMPANPIPRPGALLMGDAFNMRHPLTGGGMTVALADVSVLCEMLRPVDDFGDADAICEYTKAFFTRRKPVASTINTLAGALYKVFCKDDDEAMKEMRQACFDYLALGGVFSSGPVALLSGLNPRPLSLVVHFFAVAIYGVGRLLIPFPWPHKIWLGFRLLRGAAQIIFPIIAAEGVRKMFFPILLPSYYKPPPKPAAVKKED